MPRVIDIVQRLLPTGSRNVRGDWSECPVWPPDVFAVAATLVELSNCYATAGFRADARGLFHADFRDEVRRAGGSWREDVVPPRWVEQQWSILVEDGQREITRPGAFRSAAMRLLAASDEACIEFGFAEPKLSKLAQFVEWGHYRFVKTGGKDRLFRNIQRTLCFKVPPAESCVQPKTRTSQLGCTLRTLTHNLALLPGTGRVKSRWQLSYGRRDGPLNLMLVPFPYRIDGRAFRSGAEIPDEGASSLFSVRQTWFGGAGRGEVRQDLVRFLRGLQNQARAEVGPVHGFVIPELALDPATAHALAAKVRRDPDIELFIAGVLAPGRRGEGPANSAYCAMVYADPGRPGQFLEWTQRKHHRWCIEDSQIRRYHLGHELTPGRRWWEDTHVGDRVVHFCEFRPGAALCVLICEDLARIDPVQPVLRAIGPNLVIALLLDGPQREFRWPGRYATVLADDPGSAVLTLTSLGMVRRSAAPGDVEPRQIALFKDSPGGQATELTLPPDHHALLITLTSRREANLSLDGRSDAYRGGEKGSGGTVQLSLDGIHPITAPWTPRWMRT